MDGFFNTTDMTPLSVESLIPKCGACGIYKTCNSPKMPVTGEGKKHILIIGEAPGFDDDEQNKQFVGKAGHTLRSTLKEFDIDLDVDCYKTNALICRPTDNKTPTADEINHCRPNLTKTIRDLQPRIIIPMGAVAVKSLLNPLWREDAGSISKWVGWKIPLQKHNAWVCPIYNPSYVNRADHLKEGPAVKVWFKRHLKAAVNCPDHRPYVAGVPDYKNYIEVIKNPRSVRSIINDILKSKQTIAFDYETNRLKPDNDNAEIVCCSVHTDLGTIAYPWIGEAIEATSRLLKSSNPKVGANIKFEDRWTKRILGHSVNNWVWDTMLSAHHLDNRSGITSVKFQAFVRIGQQDWSKSIKPFLQTTDKNGLNRIREVDMDTLLIYCGMDSLMEYLIAADQRKEMKNEKHD